MARRHPWRDSVVGAWRDATDAWLVERESVAIGYGTEMAEFEARTPRPRLRDFMIHMSHGVAA